MFFAPSKSRLRAEIWIIGISKTSDHIQIKIKMPNPSQEPPVLTKAPNEDLKDIDVLCTYKIKIEIQKLGHWCTKDQWPYLNQAQDSRPPSGGTFNVLLSSKSGLKGHGCSLHLQNQDRKPKLGSRVYQRPMTISKSRSSCKTPVRNLQHPRKPQMRTWRIWIFFVLSKSR